MKAKGTTVAASLGVGFTLWRLWERGKLSSRFVLADVAPQDAGVAAAQFLPFFSFVTYKDITNTIESAAAPGQVEQTYNEFAGDAWLLAQAAK